jgi:hypothetical protein
MQYLQEAFRTLIICLGRCRRTFKKEPKWQSLKQVVVDQITVTENGIILYREATKIIEDGVELTKTYHRTSPHSRARPDWTTRTSGCHC